MNLNLIDPIKKKRFSDPLTAVIELQHALDTTSNYQQSIYQNDGLSYDDEVMQESIVVEERKGLSISDDQFDENELDESKQLFGMQISRNIQYIDDVLNDINDENGLY